MLLSPREVVVNLSSIRRARIKMEDPNLAKHNSGSLRPVRSLQRVAARRRPPRLEGRTNGHAHLISHVLFATVLIACAKGHSAPAAGKDFLCLFWNFVNISCLPPLRASAGLAANLM